MSRRPCALAFRPATQFLCRSVTYAHLGAGVAPPQWQRCCVDRVRSARIAYNWGANLL